jgi:hypothetical protein
MKNKTEIRFLAFLFIFGAVIVISAVSLVSLFYTKAQLDFARSIGVFPDPETGMIEIINQDYIGIHKVEVVYAGPNNNNGSKPFVWFVIARIWAESRRDGSPLGYGKWDHDEGGSHFLQTKEGWVMVPEHKLPGFVAFWMEVYRLAGEGNPQASHPWAEQPK